jgi:4-amino-4-deoxy-L-arabinose transferase-like glycosyltransferase
MTEVRPIDSRPASKNIELTLLLILVITGFALRVWNISSVGLDHFDEGVYVFSGYSLTETDLSPKLYPGQIKFSPPVFFGLISLAYYLSGGPSDTAAILLNIILGTLTIPLIWWVGRTWFSSQAGIAAAAILAFNEYHIILCRSGLTDIAFTLFFLIALATISIAIKQQTIGFAVVAGLAVGLAWNTKYHGWLALLITAAALVPFSWYGRARNIPFKRIFFLWVIMAVIAGICYLPWALFIQSHPGGYAEFAKYQRLFISHRHFFENLWSQMQMQHFLEGPLSRSSVLIALLCSLLVSDKRLKVKPRFLFILVLLTLSAILIGGSGTTMLLTLLAIHSLIRKPSLFPSWLVLCWLTIWLVLTPFYRPYVRLLLPFIIATHLISGFWMSAYISEPVRDFSSSVWRPIMVVIAVIMVSYTAWFMPDPSNPWRPSRSVSEAAASMQSLIPSGSRVVVIGEPTVAFYLQLSDRLAFDQTENTVARINLLENLRFEAYVVTGIYAKRAPVLKRGLQRLSNRLVPLATFQMNPKDIRVLDDFVPRKASRYRTNPDNTYELTLYFLLPSV